MYTLKVLAATLATYALAGLIMYKVFGPIGALAILIAFTVDLYYRVEREVWIRWYS
jgi:hypothetical protein